MQVLAKRQAKGRRGPALEIRTPQRDFERAARLKIKVCRGCGEECRQAGRQAREVSE